MVQAGYSQNLANTLCVLATVTAMVGHAVLVLLARLPGRLNTLRFLAVASAVCTGVLVDALVVFEIDGDTPLVRGAAASAILASFATLAVGLIAQHRRWQIGRESRDAAEASESIAAVDPDRLVDLVIAAPRSLGQRRRRMPPVRPSAWLPGRRIGVRRLRCPVPVARHDPRHDNGNADRGLTRDPASPVQIRPGSVTTSPRHDQPGTPLSSASLASRRVGTGRNTRPTGVRRDTVTQSIDTNRSRVAPFAESRSQRYSAPS
ncbi:MAG: hypothetical protein AAF743_15595, partial [Planctomycetota bacterium]